MTKSKVLLKFFHDKDTKAKIEQRLDAIARDDHRDSDYQDALQEEAEALRATLKAMRC